MQAAVTHMTSTPADTGSQGEPIIKPSFQLNGSNMSKQWVAVISRTSARFYNAENMEQIVSLRNSAAREKNRAFTTSKPGVARNRSLAKGSLHRLDGNKSPHDDAAKRFAKKIGEYLRIRFLERRFDGLLITAEPRMLGWVKSEMPKPLLGHTQWRHEDLDHLSNQELKIRFGSEK